LWLVGPDNGLLVPALDALGGPSAVYELSARRSLEPGSVTFDGRDVLAPAAAALCRGEDPASLGTAVDFGSLVRLPDPVVEHRRLSDGHHVLRVEVTWVDRFGNVQLAARPADLPEELAIAARARAVSGGSGDAPGSGGGSGGEEAAAEAELPEPSVSVVVESDVEGLERLDGPQPARCVRTFSDLDVGEMGLLTDSDGRMALVVCEDSASARLGAMSGDLVELVW
jgi:S-adenosylmethionine hydrolase